tara:strand:+ start:106 stop:378 length:273 start_codon:yes stop_codon:yes gene_type:complete
MNTKRYLSKQISKKLNIPLRTSQNILECFIEIVKVKSQSRKIKITNFGSFFIHSSPKRIGRNPKTKESYIIQPRKKLLFKASNVTRKLLN